MPFIPDEQVGQVKNPKASVLGRSGFIADPVQTTAQSTARPPLTERVNETLNEGADKINAAQQRQTLGQQSGAETGLQTFGTGLGTAGAVGYETLRSVPGVGKLLDTVTDSIGETVSERKGLLGKFLESDIGKKSIQEFQNLSDRTKANMGALFEVISSVVGGGTAKAIQQPIKTAVKETVEGVVKQAEKRVIRLSQKELDDTTRLVMEKPKKSNVISAGMEGRATQTGKAKKFDVTPSGRDTEIAKDVLKVSRKGGNVVETLEDVNKAIPNIAEKEVRPFLQSNPRAFNMPTVEARLRSIEMPDLFKTDKILENTYNLVRERMVDTINKGKKTMEGLWDSRKEFDKIVREQFGDAAFDSEKNTAVKRAIQDMRREVNNFISDEIGDETFKKQMRRISNLYEAQYNLAEKFYDLQGSNWLKRWVMENPGKAKTAGWVAGGGGGLSLLYGVMRD